MGRFTTAAFPEESGWWRKGLTGEAVNKEHGSRELTSEGQPRPSVKNELGGWVIDDSGFRFVDIAQCLFPLSIVGIATFDRAVSTIDCDGDKQSVADWTLDLKWHGGYCFGSWKILDS